MNTYRQFILWSSRIIFCMVIAVTALFLVAIPCDQLFHLGWGFHWSDFLATAGFGIFAVAVWLFVRWIFKTIRFGEL